MARRAISALAVVVAATLVAVAPANAAGGGAPKTPLDAYKRFAFEFEVAVATNDGGPGLTVSTEGVYVRPRSQDCEAKVSFGPGLELTERVVIIGDATWIDEGHGLKKDRQGDFEFESQCASSRKFWEEFPFASLPSGIHGATETRDGVAVERIDFTEIFDTVFTSGIVDELPSDVTAERALVWRAKQSGMVVGLDLALRANSPETCRDMLDLDAVDTAPPTCSMTIGFDLSRFDDPKLEVHAGGSKGRVNRT